MRCFIIILNFFLKVSKKDPNPKDRNPNRKKAWIWTGITAACLHTVKTMKTKIIPYSKMPQIVSKKRFGSLWRVSNAIDATSSVLLQTISKSILAEKNGQFFFVKSLCFTSVNLTYLTINLFRIVSEWAILRKPFGLRNYFNKKRYEIPTYFQLLL